MSSLLPYTRGSKIIIAIVVSLFLIVTVPLWVASGDGTNANDRANSNGTDNVGTTAIAASSLMKVEMMMSPINLRMRKKLATGTEGLLVNASSEKSKVESVQRVAKSASSGAAPTASATTTGGLLVNETGEEGHNILRGVITTSVTFSSVAEQRRYLQEVGRVDSVTLVNANNGNDITKITNGKTIDISSHGISFTIRANIQGSGVTESVVFDFDGKTQYYIDNKAPYTLSDQNNIAVPRIALNGQHMIQVRAKEKNNGKGKGSNLLTVYFTIKNSQLDPCKLDIPSGSLSSTKSSDVPAYKASQQGTLNGELRLWHKITIGFRGPTTCERDQDINPFTDYRLDVTFTSSSSSSSSGHKFVVPGYYAADGNAANTGSTSGDVWLVHFTPNRIGTWTWNAKFKRGTNIIMEGSGSSAGYFDGNSGSFTVSNTNKSGRDHRYHGILNYVNKHHLQYSGSGQYFLKAGADSPENFLAYEDFDNTPNFDNLRKSWSSHQRDYKNEQGTTWRGGKGTEIIGAINYLSNAGMNVFSFLSMNIQGDDRNSFPYISDFEYPIDTNDRLRIDVSKTAQWEIIFEHADHMGMYLHFKTQEHENDQLLDGGNLMLERILYYRELIARFSHHHALNWNIGEETSNTAKQQKDFANYFYNNDPYKHHVVIHTNKPKKQEYYPALLGHKSYTGASLQCYFDTVYTDTAEWIRRSSQAGHKWVVTVDESGEADKGTLPDKDDPQHNDVRKQVLWGNIMAGGAGIELYFGYRYSNSDLTCQDFRSRANMWKQASYALQFFEKYNVPFWDWDLTNNNKCNIKSGNAWCLVDKSKNTFVVYLWNGGTATIDTTTASSDAIYSVGWYDPRNGGSLQYGATTTIDGGKPSISIGTPPRNTKDDWVVLITRTTSSSLDPEPSDATQHESESESESESGSGSGSEESPPTTTTGGGSSGGGLPYIVGFKLVNAKTDSMIDNNWWLQNNDIIDTSRYGTTLLTIRAYVSGTVGSVKFGLNNVIDYNMDKSEPWLLASDYNGDYFPVPELVPPTSGTVEHIITATPYKKANGGGRIGISKTISIKVKA